jgi:non-specific serine/threonine protein kinase
MVAPIDDNQAAVLEEALTRFIDDYLRDEHPDIEEFIAQYPECEAQLKERIQDLQEIYTLFDSLVHADESDFEDSVIKGNLIGRRIRNFEVTKVIGRGGMGIVYLAHDTKLKRSVAIKSMPAQLKDDSSAQMRFRREAELLASLNHPNIAVIHEIIEEEKSGYLVLEYVPGETLAQRLAREPLELEEVLSISRQVAEAVSIAHKKGVVHRDLKPGNIKITPEGRVKVLDFGLAKTYDRDQSGSETAATHPGRVVGTPAYMSPEQARGKDTDHRTDIWSFGCIMYQMLSGHLPFEGETATDTLAHIIEREPDWQALPKQIPSNIRILLKRCLEKDFDRRLEEISDVLSEISETLSTKPMPLSVRLRRKAIIICATIAVTLIGVVTWFALTSSEEISLLVLPFENPESTEDMDLANGIMDEIKARLAGIHGLRVYKSREKGAKRMAMELGFDYILEGTLLREQQSDPNSPVRIESRLIRASDESLVWEQPYVHVGEIFQTSSDLAQKVVEVLDITLLERERQVLELEPTINLAYNFYVRGNEYATRPYQDKENLVIAIKMYEKAINLDDNFALAHACLSHIHSGMYHFNHDRSEERIAMAWDESEKALKLDPDLSEAHWARGVFYYWCRSEYVRALEELEIARKSQPNNSRLLATIGYVQRRQGQSEQALANIKKAFELNPVDFKLAYELGGTFRDMGRYQEAASYYERAIQLAPDEYFPYLQKANLYLAWKKSTVDARSVLERASQYIDLEAEDRTIRLLFRLDFLDGNYQEALARLPLDSPTTDALSFPDALRYAEIYGYKNDKILAEKYYEQARSILESKVKEDPNNAWYHSALGAAYAGLSRKNDAIREGKLAVQLHSNSKDLGRLFVRQKDLAYIYTMVGEYNKAIDQLGSLLNKPEMMLNPFELDPAWDPLRNHPRFKKLLESDK